MNQGTNIEVPALYFRYSGSSPYFLSADASKKGSPLTNSSKKVVQSGSAINERSTRTIHTQDCIRIMRNTHRELPENVLNEIELFLFNIKIDTDTAKND